jgi:hypothetical protein
MPLDLIDDIGIFGKKKHTKFELEDDEGIFEPEKQEVVEETLPRELETPATSPEVGEFAETTPASCRDYPGLTP